tara:strand:+ start:145 stop:321 length:177 start_codon:yes stop_codon:yes gene_type:complete
LNLNKIFIILFSIIYLPIVPSYSASGIDDFEEIDLSKDQKPGRYKDGKIISLETGATN